MKALNKKEGKDLKNIETLEKKLGQFYEVEKDEFGGQITLAIVVAQDFHCEREEIYSEEMRDALREVEELVSGLNLDECCENCDYFDCDEFIGIEVIFEFLD